MGVFEFDAFAKGTYGVAETLAELTPKVAPAYRFYGACMWWFFWCAGGKTSAVAVVMTHGGAHAGGAPAYSWQIVSKTNIISRLILNGACHGVGRLN